MGTLFNLPTTWQTNLQEKKSFYLKTKAIPVVITKTIPKWCISSAVLAFCQKKAIQERIQLYLHQLKFLRSFTLKFRHHRTNIFEFELICYFISVTNKFQIHVALVEGPNYEVTQWLPHYKLLSQRSSQNTVFLLYFSICANLNILSNQRHCQCYLDNHNSYCKFFRYSS